VHANNGLAENTNPAVPIARVLSTFLLDVDCKVPIFLRVNAAFIVVKLFAAIKLHKHIGKKITDGFMNVKPAINQ